MKYILSLVFLLLTSFSYATDFVIPKQTITGAEEPIPFGEIVLLSPSKIEKMPEHLVKVEYQWLVLENDKEKSRVKSWDDGSIVFGGNPSQRLVAVLSIAYHYEVKVEGKITESKIVLVRPQSVLVRIVGPDPGPSPIPPNPTPPGPTPPNPPQPEPEPTFPVGKYDLSSKTYKWSKYVVHVKKNESAVAFKNALSVVIGKMQNGSIRNFENALTEAQKSTDVALRNIDSSLLPAWDQFGTLLQEELYNLYKQGKLRTLQDLIVAYTEISLGLEKVK